MTRKRAAGLIGALVLLGLAVWVSRNVYWAEIDVPAPLRGEAAINPFYATQRFAQRLGAEGRWDRVFTQPRADAVLVLSDWRWGLSASRGRAVQAWVENGGRLVVDRTIIGDAAFQRWSGIRPRLLQDEPVRTRRRPLSGCRPVTPATSESGRLEALPFTLCGIQTRAHLEVPGTAQWTLRDGLGAQVVRVAAGHGSVTVINAIPFTGRGLFAGDHAALFVTASQLRSGDVVHFLTESDYPSLLSLAWTRGWPVIVLLLLTLGLWVWRVSRRFGPAIEPEPAARRSLEEQIRGAGEFTRRCGAGQPLLAATLRALEDTAARRIPGFTRMSGDERLSALASRSGISRDALSAAMIAESSHSHRIVDAIRTLETARRQVHTRQTRT